MFSEVLLRLSQSNEEQIVLSTARILLQTVLYNKLIHEFAISDLLNYATDALHLGHLSRIELTSIVIFYYYSVKRNEPGEIVKSHNGDSVFAGSSAQKLNEDLSSDENVKGRD